MTDLVADVTEPPPCASPSTPVLPVHPAPFHPAHPTQVPTAVFTTHTPAKALSTTITRAGITSKMVLIQTTEDQVGAGVGALTTEQQNF